jgi:hypothetical protein
MKKQLMQLLFMGLTLSLLFVACGKEDPKPDPDPDPDPSDIVTITDQTTELMGKMKGTLREGKTYTLKGDLIIPENEEIIIQPGVTLISPKDQSGIGYEITVEGSLIAQGTSAAPILMTVPQADRKPENVFAGLWGGIQCSESAKLVVLKWVRLEYLGDQGGPGTPRAGRTRYGIWTQSSDTELILEDSWVYGCKDDVYRPNGGKINLVRNTFEFCGEDGGDGLNVKAGTVGNIAYNLFIGGATNAFKPSNEGAAVVQTNINVYNNTILNNGWRRPGYSRGANINYEVGARGSAYNNIIVNCKRGIRALEDADLQNITFDHNLYYATHQIMADEFIPSDAVASTQQVLGSNNIFGGIGTNNPLFQNYNIDEFSMEQYEAGENQPLAMNRVGSNNFRLQSGSPALGAGTVSIAPVNVTWQYATGDRAPSIMQPSADLGCYPSTGPGNNHN